MALVPIILSGGAGTRLWPLSRETAPKPFMPLPGDGASGDTLLARAFLRAAALPDLAGLVTITNRDYYFHTKDAYAGAGAPLPPQTAYLLEPCARNTGPAVVLGALYAEATFGPDATLLVLPADHLIRDTKAFESAVSLATTLAGEGWLVTFGIAATSPETGYGYLELGEALAACLELRHVLLPRGDGHRGVRAARARDACRGAQRVGSPSRSAWQRDAGDRPYALRGGP